MDKEVNQLVEMGATVAQARAALRKYKDVMQAAERLLEGEFEDVMDDTDNASAAAPAGVPAKINSAESSRPRMITPHEDYESGDEHDMDEDVGDDSDGDEFVDYDSDYDAKAEAGRAPAVSVDPYAGIFFSKDRREEVIEVEEEPETVKLPGHADPLKLMTQGQWMKGCPEGGEQGFLFSLYSRLSEGICVCPNGCETSVPRKKSDFFVLFPSFSAYIEHISKVVPQTCPSCTKEFCFACGEPIAVERNQVVTGNLNNNPLFHCSELQGIILGLGLSMLEQMFTEQVRDGDGAKRAANNGKSKKRKAEPTAVMPGALDADDDDETYYGVKGKKAKGGIGYAGNQREDLSGQMEALSIQKAKDEKMANLLKAVREYLPCIQRTGGGRTSDFLVHPTTLAHLRRRFNYVGSTLLRNDSLTDMSDRSVLYFELFSWLETISNHEALASMMAMPIMVVSSVKAVTTKKSSSKNQIRERTIIYEGSSGPRELLEAIVIQAQAALKGLEGSKPAEQEAQEMTEEQKRMRSGDKGKRKATEDIIPDENAKLLDFCHRIMATAAAIDRSLHDTKGDAFVNRLKAALPKVPSTTAEAASAQARVDVGATEEDTMRIYHDWATRVRFEYCDLTVDMFKAAVRNPDDEPATGGNEIASTPHYKFFFNNEARMLANSDIPKRSLAIAKELAVLTTNLPIAWNSSIFLRVDESRVDIIKALITGPEGTPYYNGCYLFDIFLGPSYNQTPPSVKYLTTNGGKYRFNPNLYADGKVCLSLLGTWQGPSWIAGKSTLLQVLISIQSMILCEEPYLNEPGWANDSGTPQSKAYSANVRRMVVHTAMLGNLKNPPEPFEDVIKTHYRLKARSVIKQLDEWLALDDSKQTLADGGGYATMKAAGATTGSSSNGFQKDVDEMKKLLTFLQENTGTGAVAASVPDA